MLKAKPVYKFYYSMFFCCFLYSFSYGQHGHFAAPYKQYQFKSESAYDEMHRELCDIESEQIIKKRRSQDNCNLTKQVYGWHPYWVGTAYNNYDFNLLSTFSYFNYDLDPVTGSYNTVHAWKTTNAINLAKAAGCRVELCVTNFGADVNHTFLTNPVAWNVFTDTLINLLEYRDADGVNIDFESVSGSNRDDLTAFMQYLSNRLHTERPGSTVTMAIYAVDWSNVFDVPALAEVVDAFTIMGYDYHWAGSNNAGPTAPLHHGSTWGNYTLSRSVEYYLSEGIPKEKLLLGIPYYGREWKTADSNIPSENIDQASAVSRTYAWIKNNYIGTYAPQYDPHSMTQTIIYPSGGSYRQCWYDDETTIGERLDMIRDKGIAGMGIWALGYDNGYTELWDLIEENFTDCYVPCNDQNYDTGGPLGQYRNNENIVHTFTDNSPSNIRLIFTELDLELNYDYLYIHDGPNINSPLIATLNGSTLPDPIVSSGNSITIHFNSDVATLGEGWAIDWSVIPKTASTTAMDCYENNFDINFEDQEFCGTGLAHKFYLPSAFDGTEWRANSDNGFFNDNFYNNILHTDWNNTNGNWIIANGLLEQTDETNGNSNIYTTVNEDGDSPLLYHWKMKIEGSGTNRRAGMHFFCGDPSLTNRGNSYFIYYRVDGDKMQFYKVIDDNWTLVIDHPVTVNLSQWYDCKIVFDPTTGIFNIYRDDIFLSTWTDTSPHLSGGGISPRTGNCHAFYDDLKVYKGRSHLENISVGTAAYNDFQYENQSTEIAAGQIESIVLDNSNILSQVHTQSINIDFSEPDGIVVNDGQGADIAVFSDPTIFAANWTAASDFNSEIIRYWYQIGTTLGGTEILPLTDNGLDTSIFLNDLTLAYGQTYYVAVWAENCAGLLSFPVSSNGQLLDFACETTHIINNDFTSGEQLTVKAQQEIISNNTLGSNTIIAYHAGNSILLEGGFEVQLGGDFHAYILSCDLVGEKRE